ncbi:unnamed protein product [Aspergillus oryzae var. brunneus]|uniref:Unnamed protein product n=2 Tax=Aspergillus oryzae TaxID=5062 RepID=A0AAN4YKQ4_ASPOZ|nr:unnamed protein product [Aspergillus oryzae]GMG05691.1 unnamed protein product [Aspergillus oryzae]GMG28106.1 unnamed protein product [Aspergillus oryzae]GMG41470.1 unnamed protein product [Aspergillus oryzae var. brunneus]
MAAQAISSGTTPRSQSGSFSQPSNPSSSKSSAATAPAQRPAPTTPTAANNTASARYLAPAKANPKPSTAHPEVAPKPRQTKSSQPPDTSPQQPQPQPPPTPETTAATPAKSNMYGSAHLVKDANIPCVIQEDPKINFAKMETVSLACLNRCPDSGIDTCGDTSKLPRNARVQSHSKTVN